MNKSRITRILLLAMIIMAFFLPASVAAQDADATVEAMPIAIVTEEAAAPSIVCEEGATCNLNEAPADGEGNQTPVEPEPWYAKYAAGILGVLASLITIVTAVIIAINKWLESTKTSMTGMTGLEWVFKQSPAFIKGLIVALIKQFIRLGGNLQEVLAEVEDEIPFAMKQVTSPAAKPTTPYPPATGTPMDTDLTRSKTATLPTRPLDGGVGGAGGTGFPPVR